jgi:hypothetical protein
MWPDIVAQSGASLARFTGVDQYIHRLARVRI